MEQGERLRVIWSRYQPVILIGLVVVLAAFVLLAGRESGDSRRAAVPGRPAPGSEWSPTGAYIPDDVVTFDGRKYVATVGNVNAAPDGDAQIGRPQGFGAATTGGLGGEVYWVTSLADGGPGSLRAAAESPDRLWIRFRTSGPIELRSSIDVASNKTIDGRGARVELRGKGLILSGVSNVIVENIMFRDGIGASVDGITILDGSTNVWIDRCDFAGYDDGQIDVTRGGTDITVSWSRFTYSDLSPSNKAMLINGEARDGRTVAFEPRVTVHHNYFDGMTQRSPRMLHGYVHAYNNALRDWKAYGMRAAEGGELLSEGNIFIAGENKQALLTEEGRKDKDNGIARSTGDLLLNEAVAAVKGSERVFDPSEFYPTQPDTADEQLFGRLEGGAGWVDMPLAEEIWRPL